MPDVTPDQKPTGPRRISGAALLLWVIVLGITALSIWYLVRPQPLIIQGEADATRVDVAARVDGRVGERAVSRGDNVTAGQLLYRIDNPELVARLREAEAAKAVAEADLAHIEAGTRVEDIAQRKAAVESATAQLTLAQKTHERIDKLAADGNAPLQRLDDATNSLEVARQSLDQAEAAYREAVNGYTPEQRAIAHANVAKAQAAIDTIKAQVKELVVRAPIAGQVYQIGAEPGEYVAPGVPLLSLVDLGDVWLRFNLREDLIKRLKIGDQFNVRIPALGDRLVTCAVTTIAAKGEYSGWRATRATGDFDLRTFAIRAYPVEHVAGLRPGMSAYAQAPLWPKAGVK